MAVAMRLSRGGSKKRPYYRIVVADARAPRDGKYLEQIGTYNPLLAKDSPERVKLDEERARHWISVGAQPSDRVARFLDAAGVQERKPRNNPNKGVPGEKAKERLEERTAKAAEAEELKQQAENAPAEAAPAEEPPAEETPAEEAPAEAAAEAAAAEETPTEEAPAEESPTEAAPSEEAPAEEAPSEEVPAEEAPKAKTEG